MPRVVRLIREILVIIIVIIIGPGSLFLIGNYIDSPVVDALGPGVILTSFRLLETAATFAIMFGLYLLARKVSPYPLSQNPPLDGASTW
jgi:hypothetical protein